MKKRLLLIQIFLLFGGTIFAWYQWVREFLAICQACGATYNPFLSPCFFGAIMFNTALILGIIIYFLELTKK